MAKLNIQDITRFPLFTSILDNTPNTGDQTIYSAYANPSKQGNENEVVIERTIIYKNTPSLGDTEIHNAWAVSDARNNDQVEFNKKWKNRLTYDYKPLSF